jgi:hypothetical protein
VAQVSLNQLQLRHRGRAPCLHNDTCMGIMLWRKHSSFTYMIVRSRAAAGQDSSDLCYCLLLLLSSNFCRFPICVCVDIPQKACHRVTCDACCFAAAQALSKSVALAGDGGSAQASSAAEAIIQGSGAASATAVSQAFATAARRSECFMLRGSRTFCCAVCVCG